MTAQDRSQPADGLPLPPAGEDTEQPEPPGYRPAFTAFDRLVLLTLLGLVGLIGLLVGGGDRVGLRVVSLSPADGTRDVSRRAVIQVTFDRDVSPPQSGLPFSISPPISGAVRWEGPLLTFMPAQPLAAETTYTVTLAATLKSRTGRALAKPVSWQFRTGQPRLLYVTQDEQERDQLFVVAPSGGEALALTAEPHGILDYALSPDGLTVGYTALREGGGSDLWRVETDGSGRQPLLECSNGSCGNIAWFPDGRRLIYERRNHLVEGAAPGPPHLWWLDLASAETRPVFQDSQQIGYGAGFSPDGQWLSYVSPMEQGVQLFHMETGDGFLLPTQMGGPAAWHPEGSALLLTDIRQRGEGFAVHLLRADLTSSELVDLSGEAKVEDSAPAWSPDGEWIAFGRKPAGVSMGRQIWIMRRDGSQARYLTAEPEIHYGEPEWSPDGRYLLFQAFSLREVGARPGVWLYDLETDRLLAVVKPGSRPAWLP